MTGTPSFRERLQRCIDGAHSLLCVGLDPDPHVFPNAAAAERHCLALIDATADYACAYKVNTAFFECHGSLGFAAMERLRAAPAAGRLWVVDGKRGDIGNTASAYVTALFDVLGADAVTVNPLMGEDAVRPFLDRPGRGAFLLTRTSNPGATDLLEQRLSGGTRVYEHIAQLARGWDLQGAHGLVVGATAIEAISQLRRGDSDVPMLIPGVGAQGGSLEAAVSAGVDRHGAGILVNVSRAIGTAPEGPRVAARALHARIEAARAPVLQAG